MFARRIRHLSPQLKQARRVCAAGVRSDSAGLEAYNLQPADNCNKLVPGGTPIQRLVYDRIRSINHPCRPHAAKVPDR